MMCGGFYMLLNAIMVTSNFGAGIRLYRFNAFGCAYAVTSGTIMIPFIFGVERIFYNSRNFIGWLLALGSLVALVFGVIASIKFSVRAMSAFDLIIILVLSAGGLGLFVRSLRDISMESLE